MWKCRTHATERRRQRCARPHRAIGRFTLCAGVVLLACGGAATWAQPTSRASLRESRLKAAFLYRFLQFTDFGPGPELETNMRTARICLIEPGPDLIAGFGEVEGKTVGGRVVRVVSRMRNQSTEDCALAFLPTPERVNVVEFLNNGRPRGRLLVVTELESFCGSGAALNLAKVGNRFGFEVDLAAARAAGVGFQLGMLKLGRVCGKRPERGPAFEEPT